MLVPAWRPCQMPKASFMTAQIVSISQLRASIQEDLLIWNWMKQKMAQSLTAARKQRLISQKTSVMPQKSPWGPETAHRLLCASKHAAIHPPSYFSIKDFFRFLVQFCKNTFYMISPIRCPQSHSLLYHPYRTSQTHHPVIYFFSLTSFIY